MPLDIVGGVCARLAAASGFPAMLATFEGLPAILSGDVLPENLADVVETKPVCIVNSPFYDEDTSDLTAQRRDVKLHLLFYAKTGGAGLDLLTATERAKEIFRNVDQATFSTGKLEASFVSGPLRAPTEDPSIEGRLLTLSLTIKE